MSSSPAAADETQDQRDAERGRFAFAFGITSGVLIAQQNGSIDKTATIFTPNPYPPNIKFPAPFGPNVNGSVNTVSPNIGLNFEVMTPGLDFLPLNPRIFAAAEILPTFAPTQTVALNGSATEFQPPQFQQPNTFSAFGIGGQGSRLTALIMTTVVSANAGISFDFEFKDRTMRFKPFAGWIRWGVVSDGKVLQAYKDDFVIPPNAAPFFGNNIRYVTATGHDSAFFNAVGPGFELEMEMGRHGPVRPILYLMGAAYRTLGEDSFTYSSNVFTNDALGTASYSATWSFEVEPWSYRAGLGFRLRWVGFDD